MLPAVGCSRVYGDRPYPTRSFLLGPFPSHSQPAQRVGLRGGGIRGLTSQPRLPKPFEQPSLVRTLSVQRANVVTNVETIYRSCVTPASLTAFSLPWETSLLAVYKSPMNFLTPRRFS